MWWPRQAVPKGVAIACEATSLQDQMLVESVAGLAAQSVNDGTNDELVWVEDKRPDYAIWYARTKARLGFEERGGFEPWELVKRYQHKGVIKGYVLYRSDVSEGRGNQSRKGMDVSVNVATVAAGLLGGILIDEDQERKAKELGMKMLIDCRDKDYSWCFEQYKNRLNRRLLLTVNPKVANLRDMAIAHRCMVVYDINEPFQTVLKWLEPPSAVMGWNCAGEDKHVGPVSKWGHFETASDWAMNLPVLSAGSEKFKPLPIATINPARIDYNDVSRYASFLMSDGDNLQWLLGGFLQNPNYWANGNRDTFPMGWSACMGQLMQVCPEAANYIAQTQPAQATVVEFGGGYYYPDVFAENRPDRYEILAKHAKRLSEQMGRNGTRVVCFICMNVKSDTAKKAYQVYANEIEGLVGMIALQYYPYNGGDGQVFWVKNRQGIDIPVLTPKYSTWSKARWKNGGSPGRIAELINESAKEPNGLKYNLVATHAWSTFDGCDDINTPQKAKSRDGQAGLGPIACGVEKLDTAVKVIHPEEMLWRIRMEHNPQQTRQIISQQQNQLERPACIPVKKTLPKEMLLVNPLRFGDAEKVLLATLQGLTAKGDTVIWMNSGGMDRRILRGLTNDGMKLTEYDSVWELLKYYQKQVKGYVLYTIGNNSINIASSLCGPYEAVAIDESIENDAIKMGLRKLSDVREMTQEQAFKSYRNLCSNELMIEEDPVRHMYLKDFAVANKAFVFWDKDDKNRSLYLAHLKPGSLVYGYGPEEMAWVRDLSKSQCAGIPSDWCLNLSVITRLPAEVSDRPHNYPEPVKNGQRVVCFVMSDGDNIQWLLGGFVNSTGFWASRHRGSFNMTWEIAPILSEISPWTLQYYYTNASDKDDFVVGSSGLGYCFPHYLPDRKAFVEQTIPYMQKSKLSIVSILNGDGEMSDTKEFLDRPEVLGVLYKDFHPYNKQHGTIYWHKGKPCASYRFLLWDNADESRPEGLAKAIAALPASPTKDPNSYALINVHAWSFGNIGGPMEAIKKTIDLLPPDTRVVTAEQFMILLKNNFGTSVKP